MRKLVPTLTHRCVLAAAVLIALPVGLLADTLILRNGTRVRGEFIAYRNGTIEFQEQRGFGGGRTIRVDRNEVARIEFDDYDSGGGSFPGGGGGRGGMRERNVNVAASVPWSDTGIDVRPGQTVYFNASGEVTWGPGRRDGPEGENNSPRNPGRPMPNRPAAALIGKVGPGEDYFFIGRDPGAIRVRNGGRLYLGINDEVLNDNRGSFRVVVYY
jgi:hypothetical protein